MIDLFAAGSWTADKLLAVLDRRRDRPRLVYRVESIMYYTRLSELFPVIHRHNEKDVARLSLNPDPNPFTWTRIVIWNAGRVVIRRSDLTKANPLRLNTPYAKRKFIYALNWRTAAASTQPEVGPPRGNRDWAPITFDHLGHNEGFVISVFHTEGPKDIYVVGAVVGGAESPTNVTGRSVPRVPQALRRVLITPQ